MHNTLLTKLFESIPDVCTHDIQINRKKIYTVYTENGCRLSVLNQISDKLKDMGQPNKIETNYRSTIGNIVFRSIDNGVWTHIIVKPMKGSYYKDSKQNEKHMVSLIVDHVKLCGCAITVTFNSRKHKKVYRDVIGAELSDKPRSRKANNGCLNKADIYLLHTDGKKTPISIKDSKGGYHWETADTLLKADMIKTINRLIKKHDIKDFTSKYLKKDLVIDTNVNLFNCVFGSDIVNGGCIVVTSCESVNKHKHNEIEFNCLRVFTGHEVFEDDLYKPVAIILKNSARNRNHDLVRGLACVVTTQKRAKSAISVDSNISKGELYVHTTNV